MTKCTGKPSYRAEIELAINKFFENSQAAVNEFLSIHPFDSRIFISTYQVTKPTHVKKFNRMVRVRYEEERKYFATELTIKSVQPSTRGQKNLLINGAYWTSDIKLFETMGEAEKDAKTRQSAYNKSCEEAASYR